MERLIPFPLAAQRCWACFELQSDLTPSGLCERCESELGATPPLAQCRGGKNKESY